MEAPDFLVTAEAARYLGLVPETIRKMSQAGKIPAIRLGNGQRLYRRIDLDRYAKERVEKPYRGGRRPTVPRSEEGVAS
jgi:excisionase family DNA binding protein